MCASFTLHSFATITLRYLPEQLRMLETGSLTHSIPFAGV